MTEHQRKVIEKHAHDFVAHALSYEETSYDVYKMSIVRFYHFFDSALKWSQLGDDYDHFSNVLCEIGEANEKRTIEPIFKLVSDIIEEAEIERSAGTQEIEQEWFEAEEQHEERKMRVLQALAGWHKHNAPTYA